MRPHSYRPLLPLALVLVAGLLPLLPRAAESEEPIAKGKWDKEITNSIGMKLVRIPSGKFKMGSKLEMDRADDEQLHEVEITKEFWLGIHEVTQKQYQQVMKKNPSYFSKTGGGKVKVNDFVNTDDFPVENVSWSDAVAFCDRLSKLPDEKERGHKYRLPTEAEWEYACRGGAPKHQVFHFGNSLSSTQANFDGRYPYGEADKDKSLQRTSMVGSYKANGFGLFDMHGNVYEWCADWYDEDYYKESPAKDPAGPTEEGASRVIRGGSWSSIGLRCRSANRFWIAPARRYNYLGFRVALVSSGT